MRLETLRMISDWLADEDTGVNALLPAVPRDTGDPLPPMLAAVYDSTRHEHVVLRREPPLMPCLYLMTDGDVVLEGAAMTGTLRQTVEPVTVVIRYLTQGGLDAAAAVSAGEYTLRATARAVYDLMASSTAVLRNSVCLYELVRLSYVPVRETVGDAAVAGALLLDLNIRDAAP